MKERIESLVNQLLGKPGAGALVVELCGLIHRAGVEHLAFANGHWQKEKPTKPGDYPVRSVDGFYGGIISVYRDPRDESVGYTRGWGGDWWSVPYPRVPDCKY